MNRRDFLTLIASAPIAALATLPKFLPQPQLAIRPDYIETVMTALIAEQARFLASKVDVIYGHGYIRRLDANGELTIEPIDTIYKD